MNQENQEIQHDFVVEGRDLLESLDPNLMLLEENLKEKRFSDPEIIHSIFRAFHSIKGAAGFLHLKHIGKLTHHAESLLDQIRKGQKVLKQPELDLLYESGDLLKTLLELVNTTGTDEGREDDVANLVASFQARPTAASTAKEPEPLQLDGGIIFSREDVKEIFGESMRLIDLSLTALADLREDGSNRACLDNVERDIGLVSAQLNLLGHKDHARACDKLVELTQMLKGRTHFKDKHVLGLLQRVLAALHASTNQLCNGEPNNDGPNLLTLVSEFIRVETGETLSEASTDLLGEMLVRLGIISRQQLNVALKEQQRPLGEILLDMEALNQDQLELALQVQAKKQKTTAGTADTKLHSLRVDLSKLDKLGNLVGELVIAENMVTHHESVIGPGYESFRKAAQVLNRISREIQDLVLGLRMVPLSATFQKLTRAIRDIAQSLQKQVQVAVIGEDTELDKNVIDQLSSPLVHMIRNALDHGLESAEERIKQGKPAEGHIQLTASQEGGEIIIRIIDDGRGMDPEVILRKAKERGIVDSHFQGSPEEIFNLILLPGFSTVTAVTELSGRGVGMDVVKRSVEDLQGHLSITSVFGKGSCFTLRIPLTLSIIEGMLVRVGRSILTIPLLKIRESLVVGTHTIVSAYDGQIRIKIRNELIPIVILAKQFGYAEETTPLTDRILVLVEDGNRKVCLAVDEILGQRQTVIKRVSNFFDFLPGVSGFSILADGDITMVLDISFQVALAQQTGTDFS